MIPKCRQVEEKVIPLGGIEGQALVKSSNDDNDVEWADIVPLVSNETISGDGQYDWDTIMNVLTTNTVVAIKIDGQNKENGKNAMNRSGAPNDTDIARWGVLICIKSSVSTFSQAQIYIPDTKSTSNSAIYYRTINPSTNMWKKISNMTFISPVQ